MLADAGVEDGAEPLQLGSAARAGEVEGGHRGRAGDGRRLGA
jgi:hypothetical protein